MDIPAFRGQGHIVCQEAMGSDSGVIVELERPAQIGRSDAGGGHTSAHVDKWDPGRACGEVVTELWSQADEPLSVGRELRSGEQFQSKFEIAPVPMAFAPSTAEQISVGESGESQIVSFATTECRDAV